MDISKFNKLGLIVATIHFLTVVFLAVYIFVKGGDYIYFWVIFVIIDFPISLGMYLFSFIKLDAETVNSIDSLFYWGGYNDFTGVIFPAIYLGTIGSYWWYKVTSWLVLKR